MKTISRILWVIGGSFMFVDAAYLVWSLRAHNFEIVGLLTIGLSSLLCLFLAFYFSRTSISLDQVQLPEDRLDAGIDDGDAEVGFFSPWSWWPVLLAGACSLAVLGLAISAWIAIIGVVLTVITLIGWVYEYYRGNFAR